MNQGKHADIPAKEPQGLVALTYKYYKTPETCKLFFDKGEDKGLFGVTHIGANHRERNEAKTGERRATTGQTLLLQDSCIANLKVVERALWVNCIYNFDTAAQPQAHVVQASTATAQESTGSVSGRPTGMGPKVDDVTKSSEPNRYNPAGACRPALSSSGQARAKHLPRSQASDITRMTRKKCGALTMK
ncbi:hypothetical protein NEUTE1DRAFT_107235 [Neurospora tetrasperma FGSC 2508]|uniref:Uncharacterized protein n=1 Tax=Neurospora tetrasperma (strain FGSC 2508 / ATCC MYA-4615 / P0657) TaxID=510951 RepID=F8MDD3_NEUT8|nr:uncharacterized protein NEUTE1DRAFT_107235 [Neurospora tetrasperma FGSC 2508]EGO60625.1 hypothetical protein NEUTE1DRAFT_107235 [Neurospora tetrasperma FGSC 2508]EGZ75394.1 hypothetical protein NEUTE2DRAFT_136528 [Neurospora tetrasperma FGSC 2509]